VPQPQVDPNLPTSHQSVFFGLASNTEEDLGVEVGDGGRLLGVAVLSKAGSYLRLID